MQCLKAQAGDVHSLGLNLGCDPRQLPVSNSQASLISDDIPGTF